jgi:hypothetical protein
MGTAGRSDRSSAGSRSELNQRTRVAQAAARLIGDGMNDYQAAKRKAVSQLGLSGNVAMPDDAEVEAALRLHQSLFASAALPDAVRSLQQAALAALERLAQFSPWLVGPILSGAATAHTDIEMEIVGVEPKIFELHLLNQALPFALSPTGSARQDLATRYVINFGPHHIRCTIFRTEAARRTTLTGSDRRIERAQLPEARARFVTQEATRS